MTEKPVTPPADAHIAACGLFCTNCGAFKNKKCPGCQVAPKFASCGVRACCVERKIETCASCADFAAPKDFRECGKLNNWISKIFALIFRSDRPGALALLRDRGREAYLAEKRATGKH